MKKGCLTWAGGVFVSIIAIIVVAVALGVGITKPVVDLSNEFLSLIQAGKYDEAYNLTSHEFQQETSKEDFKTFVEETGLKDYQESSWNSRSVKNGVGTVEGSISTAKGDIPLRIELIKEDSQWKIHNISTDPGSSDADKSEEVAEIEPQDKLPSHSELRKLALKSLLAFNDAIQTKNFTQFHKTALAKPFKEEFSPEKLKESFKAFIESGVDLSSIKKQVAIFEKKPAIIEDVLILMGYYLTTPHPVYFELKYIQENEAWKLVGVSVNNEDSLKDSLAALDQPLSHQEEKSLVKQTLLNFNEAIQKDDFTEFHAKDLSTPFQNTYSPQELKKPFQGFIDQKVSLDTIADLDLVFDQPTQITEEGFLVIKGHYKLPSSKLNVALEYLYEEEDWKLTNLDIQIK